MRGGTVKQFLDALKEMRTVYAFKDEDTEICTRNVYTNSDNCLSIATVDEKTGIHIQMTKDIQWER